jgi:hypothetical protein
MCNSFDILLRNSSVVKSVGSFNEIVLNPIKNLLPVKSKELTAHSKINEQHEKGI